MHDMTATQVLSRPLHDSSTRMSCLVRPCASLAFTISTPVILSNRLASDANASVPLVCVARSEDSSSTSSGPGIFSIISSLLRTPVSPDAQLINAQSARLPEQSADNDGLQARLGARSPDYDDGVSTRLAARRLRNSTSRSSSSTPNSRQKPVPKRRRPSSFVFFAKSPERFNSLTFDRISNERVLYLVDLALSRRSSTTHTYHHLVTLLPYDLQRVLFDDLTASSRRSSSNVQTSQMDTAEPLNPTFKPVHSDPNKEAQQDSETNSRNIFRWDMLWIATANVIMGAIRFLSNQPPSSSQHTATAAAYTAAAMTHDLNIPFDPDNDANSAAAAFAAAAAIASSAAGASVDPAEYAGLEAAVSAARAVSSTDDAIVFIETVGVAPLVLAASWLPGAEQAAAITALANIAIVLPKVRSSMLTVEQGLLETTLSETLFQSSSLRFAPSISRSDPWFTEALVSSSHLLGSLVLSRSSAGVEFRRRMATNRKIIRRLERLAKGIRSGEWEGAARAARRALGALGINKWKPLVSGQSGLRVLCIDGGGTRAIMAFEMLKKLKKSTGREIHEIFDVIGGTSTGAIVAASIGIAHKTVEEVEVLYRDMIGKIFAKHPVNGPKMLLTRSYYDTGVLETTLQRECGRGVFIDSLADENMNRVFVVSSIMSRDPKELHVFRNYTYPVGHESRYEGSSEAQLWEGLRASSAAPTFFSEIRVDGELHADGAIVANNPTAVALHEAKCMYPGVSIELLVSLGNGLSPAHIQTEGEERKNLGWGDVVGSIVASATSTETVHHVVQDLFPEDKYFRFNPTTGSNQIDETNPETLATFVEEAQDYIASSSEDFDKVADILRPKPPITALLRIIERFLKWIRRW